MALTPDPTVQNPSDIGTFSDGQVVSVDKLNALVSAKELEAILAAYMKSSDGITLATHTSLHSANTNGINNNITIAGGYGGMSKLSDHVEASIDDGSQYLWRGPRSIHGRSETYIAKPTSDDYSYLEGGPGTPYKCWAKGDGGIADWMLIANKTDSQYTGVGAQVVLKRGIHRPTGTSGIYFSKRTDTGVGRGCVHVSGAGADATILDLTDCGTGPVFSSGIFFSNVTGMAILAKQVILSDMTIKVDPTKFRRSIVLMGLPTGNTDANAPDGVDPIDDYKSQTSVIVRNCVFENVNLLMHTSTKYITVENCVFRGKWQLASKSSSYVSLPHYIGINGSYSVGYPSGSNTSRLESVVIKDNVFNITSVGADLGGGQYFDQSSGSNNRMMGMSIVGIGTPGQSGLTSTIFPTSVQINNNIFRLATSGTTQYLNSDLYFISVGGCSGTISGNDIEFPKTLTTTNHSGILAGTSMQASGETGDTTKYTLCPLIYGNTFRNIKGGSSLFPPISLVPLDASGTYTPYFNNLYINCDVNPITPNPSASPVNQPQWRRPSSGLGNGDMVLPSAAPAIATTHSARFIGHWAQDPFLDSYSYLRPGDMYFNTTTGKVKVRTVTSWVTLG